MKECVKNVFVVICVFAFSGVLFAEKGDGELACDLANPLAPLFKVAFSYEYDRSIYPDYATYLSIKIDPTIPLKINDDWNLITHTNMAFRKVDYKRNRYYSEEGYVFQDTIITAYFSPAEPTDNGVSLGFGSTLGLPTNDYDWEYPDQWIGGPAAAIVIQEGPWTYGMEASHVWDFAGDDGWGSTNFSMFTPFVSYTTGDDWTYTLQSNSNYSWRYSDYGVAVNAGISKLINIGNLPVQVRGDVTYWPHRSDYWRDGWVYNFGVVIPLSGGKGR